MPRMDGYEATRKIRHWEQKEQRIPTPIVALTDHAMREVADEAKKAGCDLYVTKPIVKARLLEIVNQFSGEVVD
ncbi:response regulator [Magnetococcales bacterium HHB-1]